MRRDRIVIGASAGGVSALGQLVSQFEPGFDGSIFVVQHISSSESALPEILSRSGPLAAEHPMEGTPIRPGHIFVAPPDHHMVFDDGCIRLSHGPRENFSRPSIDVTFRSAACTFGARCVGVLLTGLNDDGALGLLDIQRAGGIVAVQDPAEAAYPDMPAAALRYLRPDHVIRISTAGTLLMRLADSDFDPPAVEASTPVTCNQEPAGVTPADDEFTCPECGGVIKPHNNGNAITFRCYVGHAFSPETMMAAESDSGERALWAAVRALEDSSAVAYKLAGGAGVSAGMRRVYQERAGRQKEHARIIRTLLKEG